MKKFTTVGFAQDIRDRFIQLSQEQVRGVTNSDILAYMIDLFRREVKANGGNPLEIQGYAERD